MKKETKSSLRQARSDFGKCAKAISTKETASRPLTPSEMQMLIGFGTARDWVRWAATLDDLKYTSQSEERSARRQGITEAMRFNQMWTATNALFAKDDLLALTGTVSKLPNPELGRFKILYNFADIDPNIERSCVTTLTNLLSMECKTADAVNTINPGSTPTMWDVIDQKYSRPEDRKRGIGKMISTALASKKLPSPDGAELIYGARNWAVHGMLLTSFFRGSKQKYICFIDNITHLLSAVLEGAASNYIGKI